MIYVLKHPVTVANATYTEFDFKEKVKAKHYRGLKMEHPMPYDDVMTIAGRLCGQPSAVMDEVEFPDMQEIILLVQGFLGLGQEDGKTPSQQSPQPSDSPTPS